MPEAQIIIIAEHISYQFHPFEQSGDSFVVKVRVANTSAARMFFEHLIFKLPTEEVRFSLLMPYFLALFLQRMRYLFSCLYFSSSFWRLKAQQCGLIRIIALSVFLRKLDQNSIYSCVMESPADYLFQLYMKDYFSPSWLKKTYCH